MPQETAPNDAPIVQEEVIVPSQTDGAEETQEETPHEEPKREFSQYEKELYAQLQKTKAKVKELEAGGAKAPTPEPKKETKSEGLTREEAKLYAKGFEDADIDDARFVADRKGISISEAIDTREFKTMKSERDREMKEQAASLRAASGSQSAPRKTLKTPGLTREEHRKLWAQD